MKLFLFKDLEEIRRVVNFLDRVDLTNRYRRLVIAKDYNFIFDEESGESEIKFVYN